MKQAGFTYVTPTVRRGYFGYFDTAGRFWTPAWDQANDQPRDVHEVQLADGSWHAFEGFVSEAEALAYRHDRGAEALKARLRAAWKPPGA